MRDYDQLFKELKYPELPVRIAPKRGDFPSNTTWGAAMDAHEEQIKSDTIKFKEGRNAYLEAQNALTEQFWDEVYAELGWDKLPKEVAGKLGSIAWEKGHSYGYNEVYSQAEDFSDLVDAILKTMEIKK